MCKMLSLVVLVPLLALSSCASAGPIGEPDAAMILARDIGLHDGESIAHYSRANWIQGADGHSGIWEGQNMKSILTGVLVCTDTRVVFVLWDEERGTYTRRLDLHYASLTAAETKTFGRGRRLVVRSDRLDAYTFEITGTAGAIDTKAFEEIAAFIAARIPQQPVGQ